MIGQFAFAQQKQGSGGCPDPYYRGTLERKVIDRASIRILYAWNAEDIKDMNTYLDLGQLQIGKTCTKYCSLFAEKADDTFEKWHKGHSIVESSWLTIYYKHPHVQVRMMQEISTTPS